MCIRASTHIRWLKQNEPLSVLQYRPQKQRGWRIMRKAGEAGMWSDAHGSSPGVWFSNGDLVESNRTFIRLPVLGVFMCVCVSRKSLQSVAVFPSETRIYAHFIYLWSYEEMSLKTFPIVVRSIRTESGPHGKSTPAHTHPAKGRSGINTREMSSRQKLIEWSTVWVQRAGSGCRTWNCV